MSDAVPGPAPTPEPAVTPAPGLASSSALQARIVVAARASGRPLLDAGRGQPNWTATLPRAAFFRLGTFAVEEAARVSRHREWGELPPPTGLHDRLLQCLAADGSEGAGFLADAVAYAVSELGVEPDAFVHELVRGVLGAGYPAPTRMLTQLERILERYLVTMTGAGEGQPGAYQVFATEGGAAAMAYVFRSLRENHVIGPDDAVAIATPVFTPYLQIPVLAQFGVRVVEVPSAHNAPHRFDDGFLDRLLDPSIKVFFVINPGNPDTRAIRPEKLIQLRDFVIERRPDLVVVADTAYATFVDGFRGVLSVLPRHTIVLHSFSKNFGATGNRLGFMAMASDTVVDDVIAAQPAEVRALHDDRYSSVGPSATHLPFMSRVVADSREVALHNIAGLSTAGQVQMALFALAYLMPSGRTYLDATRAELARRSRALFEPLGIEPPGGQDSLYYALIDLVEVVRTRRGDRFADVLVTTASAEDVVLRLAAEHGVIVQVGGLFGSQAWDVRVSLASLDADQLRQLGHAIVAVVDGLTAPGT
ncbi:bifunctional aspartate transaminase/aspartate 4-decarboxylase [Humibacillus xanthopallidus]|uniref:Aminotransferase n=1 Tax=Humibacillus xanthopallidus TaxID=412689 RepID=A0A543HUF5_9MICO|nr:bifunctional aspartate transaminase/aspartate 4-decarboxylase [Humibacillus xanthopallidus]TQM61965.1 aspartate 4-decarboxylase [Humibacillus xanthopallidus]